MIPAHFAFVPPGGGEANYSIDVEIPGMPSIGDYVKVTHPDEGGTRDFIVRRLHWGFIQDDGKAAFDRLTVECEYSQSYTSSERHKKMCKVWDDAGTLQKFDDSAF
jgi:hypothetical protein